MTLLSPPSLWMSLCAYACAAASYAPSLSDSDRGQVAAALVVGPPLFNSIEFDFSKKNARLLNRTSCDFFKRKQVLGEIVSAPCQKGWRSHGAVVGPSSKEETAASLCI